jgi:hypothetical protein
LKVANEIKEYAGAGPIDIWVSSCHINSCDDEVFQQIELLSKELNLRNIVIPMFDL